MAMTFGKCLMVSVALAIGSSSLPASAADFTTATYRLAVADAVQSDKDLAKFYKETAYQPLWTGRNREDRDRRDAFFDFLGTADFHGLPAAKYNVVALKQQTKAARTQADLAALEVTLSETFLSYAQDIQTGLLKPAEVDEGIVRKVPYRKRISYLTALEKSSPAAYFRALAPTSAEYARLAVEKMRLRDIIASGDWGEDVPDGDLVAKGARGDRIATIRNRLIALGYLDKSFGSLFDQPMEDAITVFQLDHGLKSDGVVGPSTVEMLNMSAEDRLKAVIVAMERERWINMDLGDRHVLVNLTDFNARIIDNGETTFETRSVIGNPDPERQSPEFSDQIEMMVINPTWHVPRSIATKEYLPVLKEDSTALDFLNLFGPEGEPVDRKNIDFTQFTEEDFPFDLKQAPSSSNALGLVKFLFPNRYNIYLHDTPSKSLFAQESRAFSHGCIRLQDPFEFAYALLAVQEENPEQVFLDTLAKGTEETIYLNKPVPVHLIYRTAVGNPNGRMEYRRDVYGRDAEIWDALSKAGVELLGQAG